MEIVEGEAPGALAELPAPTHVFIGGSGGALRGIIAAAVEKNPAVRIVVNTVTLESTADAIACMRQFRFAEAVQVNVSRSREIGEHRLMTAQNPVTVFTLQGAIG